MPELSPRLFNDSRIFVLCFGINNSNCHGFWFRTVIRVGKLTVAERKIKKHWNEMNVTGELKQGRKMSECGSQINIWTPTVSKPIFLNSYLAFIFWVAVRTNGTNKSVFNRTQHLKCFIWNHLHVVEYANLFCTLEGTVMCQQLELMDCQCYCFQRS